MLSFGHSFGFSSNTCDTYSQAIPGLLNACVTGEAATSLLGTYSEKFVYLFLYQLALLEDRVVQQRINAIM